MNPLLILKQPEYCLSLLQNGGYSDLNQPDTLNFFLIPVELNTNIDFQSNCIDSILAINNPQSVIIFFRYLNKIYKQNIPENLILKGIESHANIIQYGSDKIKNDFDVGMKIIKKSPASLCHLSIHLRNNVDIVKEAILSQKDYRLVWIVIGPKLRETIGANDIYQYFNSLKNFEELSKKLSKPTIKNKKTKI